VPGRSSAESFLKQAPLVVLGMLTILLAVVYRNVFNGEIAGDDLTFHLAESTRLADCLRAGDFDWWNPSANAGFASAYYYQVIPQLVPAAFAALTGTDVLFWFQLGVFLPLVLAPAAAYRALRLLGTTPWAAVGGAFAVAMAVGNNRWGHGADGTFSVGLYTQTWALAAFPLALAHGVRWLRDGEGLAPATAWGLFVGLCHPVHGVAIGIALFVGVLLVPLGRVIDRAIRGAIDRELPQLGVGAEPGPIATAHPAATAIRMTVLGALLLVGATSAWLPVLVDYDGFGAFPKRVDDEVGPGFGGLMDWLTDGVLLDADNENRRWPLLTALLPITALFARGRALAWLWSGAIGFGLLLSIGKHLVTKDDLLPAVRFLGPFQICLALAIGSGAVTIGFALWRRATRLEPVPMIVAQTAIAAVASVIVVSITVPAVRAQMWRTNVSWDYPKIHRDEITEVIAGLAALPPGRKNALAGTGNHWFNLLPYVHARIPAHLQMGGAGLQSSPNYEFISTTHDATRAAWVFDAPYITYLKSRAHEVPDGEPLFETETFGVRKLPSPGLVSPVAIVGELPPGRHASRDAVKDWLTVETGEPDDPRDDRLLAYAGDRGLREPPNGRTIAVHRQPSPDDAADIVASVHADGPTTFVIRESWHPRWVATVDNQPVPVRRVTPSFLAVDIHQAGDHLIELRFDRPIWVLFTWLLIPFAIIAGWLAGPIVGRLFNRGRSG
jgi:hypothetical protein